MQEKIEALRGEFRRELEKATTHSCVEALRVKYLGRKGPIQALMPELKTCTPEERPQVGQAINTLKVEISEAIDLAKNSFFEKELEKKLSEEEIDITLPGKQKRQGRKHIISQIIDEVADIHKALGFSMQTSPDVETEYYNYDGLNYPKDHPARDMQDTYYLDKDNLLLRSHTTSFQQHIMENCKPPMRVFTIGKCYRNETISARSHVLFHQVDGMYIDENVTFADLISTLTTIYSRFFKKEVKLRTRPSYFPFVEPGMEIDVFCTSCNGKGCSLCKHTGWLEVCGAGMIHPEVLLAGGIDPERYSGYAWGGGIERLALLRHNISDIRLFWQNDMRLLSQF